MNFATLLREVVEDCGGGIGAALMGSDGIPIAQFAAGDSEEMAAAGAEFGRILDEIRKAADALRGGAVLETIVVLTRFSLVLRSVDEDVFLVLAVAPDGNLGKARYLIRRQLHAIRREL